MTGKWKKFTKLSEFKPGIVARNFYNEETGEAQAFIVTEVFADRVYYRYTYWALDEGINDITYRVFIDEGAEYLEQDIIEAALDEII